MLPLGAKLRPPPTPQAPQPHGEDVLDQVTQLETESSSFHHLNTLWAAAVSFVVAVKDSMMAAAFKLSPSTPARTGTHQDLLQFSLKRPCGGFICVGFNFLCQ